MILADKIAQDVIGGNYFQSLFNKCVEYSFYQLLNLDDSILYSEKEYKDLLRFAELLSLSTI